MRICCDSSSSVDNYLTFPATRCQITGDSKLQLFPCIKSHILVSSLVVILQMSRRYSLYKSWCSWFRNRLCSRLLTRMWRLNYTQLYICLFFSWVWNLLSQINGKTHLPRIWNWLLERILGILKGVSNRRQEKLHREELHNLPRGSGRKYYDTDKYFS